MLKILFFTLVSFGSDSVRTEVINGKTFIIHKVEAKETLFSISKKYGVALLGVVESNPGADSGLDVGQEIKVPYSPNNRIKTKAGTVHKVGQKETLYSIAKQYGVTVDELKAWNGLTNAGLKLGQELIIKDKVTQTPAAAKTTEVKSGKRHVVAAGETMYAITRQYNITVSQLKDWNNLTSNDLKPGQEIMVAAPGNATVITDLKKTTPDVAEPKKEVVTENRSSSVIAVTPASIGTDETRESGMADLLENTEGSRKYLAHHRTIKVGSIVRVKNNLTRKEIFVRIIGTLSNSESPDVLLKLSKSAYDKLGGDGKFAVEVTYFK